MFALRFINILSSPPKAELSLGIKLDTSSSTFSAVGVERDSAIFIFPHSHQQQEWNVILVVGVELDSSIFNFRFRSSVECVGAVASTCISAVGILTIWRFEKHHFQHGYLEGSRVVHLG